MNTTKIQTVEQAREYIKSGDRRELQEDIAGIRNVDQVEMDIEGDVWVGNPQPHWLTPDELIDTVNRLPYRR